MPVEVSAVIDVLSRIPYIFSYVVMARATWINWVKSSIVTQMS